MVKNTEVISRQPNNFGALRLFFAFLVIFSHSPEIIDGNNSREFLNQITNGTMVSGTVGVCGFFLVSGYLIFNSYQHSISLFNYLNKRLLRIFPGFIVAYIVSILVFSSISGGWNLVESYLHNWPKNFVKMLLLYQPIVDGVFKENHIHTLNVSMWTIQIEFLCYLMTPLFAILYLRNKSYYLTLMVLVSFFYLFLLISGINFNTGFPFFIQIPLTVRPITAFIIGGAFYIFKDKLLWNNISAIIYFFYADSLLVNTFISRFRAFILWGLSSILLCTTL